MADLPDSSSQANPMAVAGQDRQHLGRTASLNGVSPQVLAVVRQSRGINLPSSSTAFSRWLESAPEVAATSWRSSLRVPESVARQLPYPRSCDPSDLMSKFYGCLHWLCIVETSAVARCAILESVARQLP